ncbi:MAG: hypothetical protein FWD33_02090 [Alphaproteobacteria bacterium]|nr:hypothetical protein [Alphaproteobacteria bacterium]
MATTINTGAQKLTPENFILACCGDRCAWCSSKDNCKIRTAEILRLTNLLRQLKIELLR